MNGLVTGLALAVILAVEAEHSIAGAGIVVAAMAIASAASAPFRGRVVDRRGHRVLLPLALISAPLTVLLGLLTPSASIAVLAIIGATTELFRAPVTAGLRALWKEIAADEHELDRAYSLQAILNEIIWILGPLLAGGIVAFASAQAAVVAIGCCQLAGVILFASSPLSRGRLGAAAATGRLGALASPGMWTLVVGNVGFGFLFGSLDVAAAAFAAERGHEAAAGIALAAMAVGSALGGISYGARRWSSDMARRYLGFTALLLAGVLPIALASSIPGLVALMMIGGLALAPVVAIEFALIDRVAPEGTATEAMTWLLTTSAVGAAAGAFVAGQVASGGEAGLALLISAGGPAFALIVTSMRYATLKPQTTLLRIPG